MNHENNFWDLIEKIAAIGGIFAFLAQLIHITNKTLIWLKEEKESIYIIIIKNIFFKIQAGTALVEDPRVTKVDDKFYMTYVAFDGTAPPRVALTSIGIDDFLNRRWDKWERPKLISSPGILNKKKRS